MAHVRQNCPNSPTLCLEQTSFLCLLGTGEHGVGLGKKRYLVEELGEETVALMKAIKNTLDPLNLFNPGKVSCLAFLWLSTYCLCS